MSVIPVLGLTYDGEDIQDLNGLFLQIVSGLYDGLDVRGQDVTIPYLAGQVARARRRHTRRIMLKGFVRGADPTATTEQDRQMDYSVKARDVETLFDPARLPADLEVTFPDTSRAIIACRPLNVIPTPQVIEEFTSLDIELLSVSPDWEFFGIGAVVPTPAALILTRFPPTVDTFTGTVTPSTRALTTTRYAPTVGINLIVPPPASLTLTRFAPTVTSSG